MGENKGKIILQKARKEGFAVPAFNIYNLETMQVVLETAARMQSPVMLATTPSTVNYFGHDFLLALAEKARERYKIPVVFHLDHFQDKEELKKYIKAGFSSGMIDASRSPYTENVEIVKEVVSYARGYGAVVEAELGNVGRGEQKGTLTEPGEAKGFVRETGVDSLAVAIGTVHGIFKGKPNLDFKRLEEISNLVDIPLVLHGGSGLSDNDLKETIKRGISKINIATELKEAFTDGLKNYFQENPEENDLRHYMEAGKKSMEKVVAEKIKVCGSGGRG